MSNGPSIVSPLSQTHCKHTRKLYISCHYCHLIEFCFSSSNSVSISLTSSLFILLFSLSELFSLEFCLYFRGWALSVRLVSHSVLRYKTLQLILYL